MLDKSACVLVANILGAAVGDLQPAMNSIASVAAAELHPGGKDGEVTCYWQTGGKQQCCITAVTENIAVERIRMLIVSTLHMLDSTSDRCDFEIPVLL